MWTVPVLNSSYSSRYIIIQHFRLMTIYCSIAMWFNISYLYLCPNLYSFSTKVNWNFCFRKIPQRFNIPLASEYNPIGALKWDSVYDTEFVYSHSLSNQAMTLLSSASVTPSYQRTARLPSTTLPTTQNLSNSLFTSNQATTLSSNASVSLSY